MFLFNSIYFEKASAVPFPSLVFGNGQIILLLVKQTGKNSSWYTSKTITVCVHSDKCDLIMVLSFELKVIFNTVQAAS